jgi:hypothetical protein
MCVCTVRAPVLSSSISEVCHPLWLSVQGTCSVERTVVPQALLMPAALSCAANGSSLLRVKPASKQQLAPPESADTSQPHRALCPLASSLPWERGHDLLEVPSASHQPSGTLAC